MSTRLHIVVSEELLARIDASKGLASRSAFVREATERYCAEHGAMLSPEEGSAWLASLSEKDRAGLRAKVVPEESSAPAEQSRRSGPDVAAFRRATQR